MFYIFCNAFCPSDPQAKKIHQNGSTRIHEYSWFRDGMNLSVHNFAIIIYYHPKYFSNNSIRDNWEIFDGNDDVIDGNDENINLRTVDKSN